MGKRRNQPAKRYVDHPRFGTQPIPSGFNYTKEDIDAAHWRYPHLTYFPETAIPADTGKQNFSIFPRSIYVDIEEHCEVCKRPFLFFAQEQKHWFETLGFWVDAHCTRCTDCRRKDHEIKAMQREYESLTKKPERSEAESKRLKYITLELYQLGYIRDPDKIDKV